MEAWERLGGFLSEHMVAVIPVCLALGIFLPQVFSALNAVVVPLFMVMAFQGALCIRLSDVRDTFAHPLPLLGILAFSHLLMPLAAFALARPLFGESPVIVAGFVLEYSVPVATSSLLWVSMCAGDVSLCLSAVLISAVICPFTLPAAMGLLVGEAVSIDVPAMMGELLIMVALPAVAATALNEKSQGWGSRVLSPALAPLARIMLVLLVIANSTGISEPMLRLTAELVGVLAFTGVFCAGAFGAALLAGRLCRLRRPQAAALAFAGAMKNISAGAVVAMTAMPAGALFPVMAGTLFQQFLAAACGRGLRPRG
ncbi:bile acid:sodium symporter family protein [Olsenella sp. HMSC062G07]|uniref:bile acid:sodium symporter family protein n=1 Tax=Olsenella sp. HMSC062G07 TaxID=1739330 RepID=UPI0008A238D1|nr:bile acid:sodium symporter [Olsenella sp. HMSC062G07]OFK24821.1 hypothetical protein HMPREF2826_06255 [Olsenella sp. HMSC062G07]